MKVTYIHIQLFKKKKKPFFIEWTIGKNKAILHKSILLTTVAFGCLKIILVSLDTICLLSNYLK